MHACFSVDRVIVTGEGRLDRLRSAAVILLGIAFVAAGANHFRDPGFYLRMMPPYLPAHAALVQLSGVFEILGGVGVWLPATRRVAGWGLVLLLLAVFPANVHMALNPELFPEIGTLALWGRLPFQAVFIAWVWWACRLGRARGPAAR